MGAKGAAVATVIAQGTSGVLCLFYIIAKVPVLHLKREDFYVESDIYKNQLRIGIPMALQYSITAIGTMMVQSSLNILGSTLVAAYTAAGMHDHRCRVFCCSRSVHYDGGKIYDLSVCIRRCKCDHEFC